MTARMSQGDRDGGDMIERVVTPTRLPGWGGPQEKRSKSSRSTRTRRVPLWLSATLSGVLIGLFAATHQFLLPLWALLVLSVVAFFVLYASWRRPAFGLILLVVGVPFQELIFGRLFSLGIPLAFLAPVRFWKEVIVLTLVCRVLAERRERLDAIDRASLWFLGVIGLYLVIPVGPAINLRFLAARQIASFLLVFFAARYLVLDGPQRRRIENAILLVGSVIAALAYWNYFDPSGWTDWVISNRIMEYRNAVAAGRAGGTIVTHGQFGGETVVRTGSLLLSPLTLPYYLAVPTTIALVRSIRRAASWPTLVVGVACAGAIILTYTRSAIVLMPIAGLLALATSRNKVRLVIAIVAGVLILAPVVGGSVLSDRLRTSFDPDDPSRSLHETRVSAAVERLWERPLGSGLASSAGQDFRFNAEGRIVTENWYLQVGLDLGILPMLLVACIFIAVLRGLWQRAQAGSSVALAGLCALAWVALGALFLQHLSDLTVSWSVWLLSGLAYRTDESDEQVLEPVDRTASVNPVPVGKP